MKVTETSNFPVQGTLADIIGPAMLRIADEVGWSVNRHLVADIHDELLLCTNEVELDAVIMNKYMTQRLEYNGRFVDMTVGFKVGKNWGKYHPTTNPDGQREMSLEDIRNGKYL